MTDVELNPEFKTGLDILENSSENLFLTGKAGTGKSTFLSYHRENTKKNVVVLAPTGVAALNVQGETIHKFFGFKPDITVEKAATLKPKKNKTYKELDTIIIDEISMVRADLLDCIDVFLKKHGKHKKKPFGGVQMVFIGDLYQLPPVVTSKERNLFKEYYKSQYFFDAKCFEKMDFKFVELEKIYRQKDAEFIGLLNAIRNNSITDNMLTKLNSRVGKDFEGKKGLTINLTTTNQAAAEINSYYLKALRSEEHYYLAETDGEIEKNQYPNEMELTLKAGAQVMFLNNDTQGRWVNGTLGEISGIEYDTEAKMDIIYVELPSGEVVDVTPNEWDLFHFTYDKKKKQVISEITGKFIQYPLRPAWAITIHKSQGKTFERVIVDIGKGSFAHGQVYVALSRCTSFGGLILERPIEKKHVFCDWKVVNFMAKYKYALSDKEMPLLEKEKFLREAAKNKKKILITYLKADDTKSIREVTPTIVKEMEYMGKKFLGISAYCFERKEQRTFRVDRILKIQEPKKPDISV